jgi:phosphoribosylformylglycinamidine synthase
VDCLNGGNPEKPDVYGGFTGIVDGLADACSELGVPVVGGNVSLYNDSAAGPIPPTPTLAMVGTKDGYDAPSAALEGRGDLLVVNDRALAGEDAPRLGGSEFLAQFEGTDQFPMLPDERAAFVEALATVANDEDTLAVHDASHGGLAATLAELVTPDAGATVTLDEETSPGVADGADPTALCFHEQPGRVVIETTDPAVVHTAFNDVAPVTAVGQAEDSGSLDLTVGDDELRYDAATLRDLRSVIERELA